MTAIATNAGHRGTAIDGLIADLVARFHSWNARRETRAALNALSERELQDIGLCRADIDAVIDAI